MIKKTVLLITFTVLLTVGFSVAHAQSGDYNLNLSPMPNSNNPVLGGDGYDFQNQSFPIITITPSSSSATIYSSYELTIINPSSGSAAEWPKGQWTNSGNSQSFAFTPYSWSLCVGNSDHTSGAVLLVLKGTRPNMFGTGETTEYLVQKNIFITNYRCQSTSLLQPDASLLTPTIASTTSSSAKLSVSGLALSDFLPNAGPYEYHIYVDGTEKGVMELDSGNIAYAWDTSNTAAGQHTIQVDFRNTSDSSVVHSNPNLTVYKKTDGTISVTPDSGGGGNNDGDGGAGGGGGLGNQQVNGTLTDLKFSVPTLGFLANKSGIDLIKAAFVLVIDYLLILISISAVVVVIWNGILYGMSFGDPAKAEKAKKGLMYAIYGIVAVLLCIIFITIVSNIIKTIQ